VRIHVWYQSTRPAYTRLSTGYSRKAQVSALQRYIRAAENELAVEEARRLFDGEA
jgi:hypothetical protein